MVVEVRWKVQPGSNRADVMVTDSNGDLQWESREIEIERERERSAGMSLHLSVLFYTSTVLLCYWYVVLC